MLDHGEPRLFRDQSPPQRRPDRHQTNHIGSDRTQVIYTGGPLQMAYPGIIPLMANKFLMWEKCPPPVCSKAKDLAQWQQAEWE